jgi:hypothetical protein
LIPLWMDRTGTGTGTQAPSNMQQSTMKQCNT